MTDASGLPPGLDGRVAIVTGAGRMRSIGRAIAVELARAGCDVVVTGSGRPAHLRPVEESRPAGRTSSRWRTRCGASGAGH